ncbi:MAG: hypothetical protein O3A39_04775 [Proteobacteria bacterium]|nr:hypothetical protein [Pseudomonadota bacterium]
MSSENLDIDKMFFEEMKLHNYLIETSSELQTIFSKLTVSAFSCSDSIGLLVDLIQKKEFDQAREIISNAVYSLSNLSDTLVSLIDKLNHGVLNGEETYGD